MHTFVTMQTNNPSSNQSLRQRRVEQIAASVGYEQHETSLIVVYSVSLVLAAFNDPISQQPTDHRRLKVTARQRRRVRERVQHLWSVQAGRRSDGASDSRDQS